MPEIVIEWPGMVQFPLPAGHTCQRDVDEDGFPIFRLDTPSGRGGTYSLVGEPRQSPDGPETVWTRSVMREEHGDPPGYPFPTIAQEIERLQAGWVALGGDPTRFDAWAPGDSNFDFLTRKRAEIRQLQRPGDDAQP